MPAEVDDSLEASPELDDASEEVTSEPDDDPPSLDDDPSAGASSELLGDDSASLDVSTSVLEPSVPEPSSGADVELLPSPASCSSSPHAAIINTAHASHRRPIAALHHSGAVGTPKTTYARPV
jgi:hypothetical protein